MRDAEALTINGHDAAYVCNTYTENAESEEASDERYFDQADASEMKNTHQIGDKVTVISDADEGEIRLEASVTDVQVADDLSLLTNEASIPDDWKELVGADGKLIPDTLNYVKYGDGKYTLSETVRTEKSPVKLVYATVEYTNHGKEAVPNCLK